MWSINRPDPVWIKTPEQASRLKEMMACTRYAAIDTETTGLDICRDSVLFWSLSLGDDRYFLERKMLDEFRPVFKDPDRIWLGTHTKYDAHMLANSGVTLRGDLHCTLVMDRLLDSERDHGLKEVYEREFNEKVQTFGETFYPRNKSGKPYKPKGKSMGEIILEKWEVKPKAVIDYASLDAWMSYRLWRRLKKHLLDTKSWRGETLWSVFLRMEVPFTKVLYSCERMGTLIDEQYLKSLKEPMLNEMGKTERELNKAAGRVINVKSTPQLRDLFYGKLRMRVTKKTKKGAPSTDASMLEQWSEKGVKEAKLVLRYRQIQKIESTYVSGILKAVDNKSRLHGSLNQHVTKTGRLSSSDPNMQNIPRPSGDEFKIRRAFIARPGYSFVSADYSQLEMYLMAHWSGDPNMVEAILKGRDLHSANAAMIWNVPYKDIVAAVKRKDSKQPLSDYDKTLLGYRQYAKTICFGLLYGKGPMKLANELDLEAKVREESNRILTKKDAFFGAIRMAKELTRQFFDGIPGAEEFILRTHERTAETKYVETITGRRRWLRSVMDLEEQQEHQYEAHMRGEKACSCSACKDHREGQRQAVNTIIQGSAADVVQEAMNKMHNDEDLVGCNMLFQVHDEVNFEVPNEILTEACKKIKWDMENCGITGINVPLLVEPGHGDSWVDAH